MRITTGFRRSIFIIVAATLPLLLLEFSLHAAWRMRNGEWLWQEGRVRSIPYIEPVPDHRGYSLIPGYRDAGAGITIDHAGFRTVVPRANEGDEVVAFIGDSVPFGVGVRDEESCPAILGDILAASGIPIRVVNGAVPSYNFRQSFERFRVEILPRYRTSLLVVHAANDVSLLSWFKDDWTPEVTWASTLAVDRSGVSRFLATAHYLKSAAGNMREIAKGRPERRSHSSWPTPRLLEHLRREIRTFLDECERNGIRVIVLPVDPYYYHRTEGGKTGKALPVAAKWGEYREKWQGMIDSVNDCISEEVARHPGAGFLDTRPVRDSRDRAALYLDFIHLTPSGNRELAEELFRFGRGKGFLPGGKPAP
jgi:lysophospholipase L1-like esterase